VAEHVRIPAKTLGGLAMPNSCPRCFWIQQRAKNLPYQIFPGIFSSIDSYEKKIVHGWFDRHAAPPPWLAPLGEIQGYVPPPHHSKFQIRDEQTGIVLSGVPDGILTLADGSHIIVDYKTAKFTEFQDELFPMYEAQLNAYAHIGERVWTEPVSALALVYTEPVTDDATAHDDANMSEGGFQMPFSARILPVQRKPELIPELLRRAKGVLDLEGPPPGRTGCMDCQNLENLISIARG
jgi:PD-(D/E)XK nuclease superfamily